MMNWNSLLSQNRIGKKTDTKIFEQNILRNAYEKDYDRIIFSTYFKRLQNKTQVFPFPENTIIHNRLTHSIEVSVVGRSLGKYIGNKVLEIDKTIDKNITLYDFGEIVSTACLFHDIGNPPFGHSGESSISDFFKSNPIGIDFIKNLKSPKEINDFYNFEGNAEGLRIIFEKILPLTHASVGAFLKYPREICETPEEESSIKKRGIHKKKNGVFQSEIEKFQILAEDLGLIKDENENIISYFRHPLSYLVEASDDICYRLMDLEDAVRLDILKIDEVKEMMFPIIEYYYESLGDTKRTQDFLDKYSLINGITEKMEYLRAKVVGILVEIISNVFFVNYEKIMNGELETDLFKCLDEPYIKALDNIKKETGKRVFTFRPVLEIEAAGYEIIGGLLEVFIGAIIYDTNKYRQYFELLPEEIKVILKDENVTYHIKGRIILDYISGMTDNYALNLYKKLKGIELPRIY